MKGPDGSKETRKRRREIVAIAVLALVFISIAFTEWRLTRFASTLPFANSIFFFGLININIILLVALLWLIVRNLGKIVIERRNRVLGSRLKTKLVAAFLAFSITPTLILFAISSLYINSSFDKWFSIKIQNTLQAAVEIGRTYYKNTDQRGFHFARHISEQLSSRIQSRYKISDDSPPDLLTPAGKEWIRQYLDSDRDFMALDSVEFYADPLGERLISVAPEYENNPNVYPRLALDTLETAFSGENVALVHHVGTGDLIRTLTPVWIQPAPPHERVLAGVVSVNTYIPISLASKVDEVATVFDDYRDTNPLIYPIKTQYLVILLMITLVIIAVAIWIGLHLARELTVPVERLVTGARQVGAGNLDVTVEATGDDELRTLVDAFNRMTHDLKESRNRLEETSRTVEERRLQLETILANIGTGVLVVDRAGVIMTCNRAAALLLGQNVEGRTVGDVLQGDAKPFADIIEKTLTMPARGMSAEVAQWNFNKDGMIRSYAGIATPLYSQATWGAVVVIDDITHLSKAQREMAWREVARRIAHEIKNPLTPIKLSAQRLKRRLGNLTGQDGALLRECTDTIVQNTDELKEMVNEFSNFARLPEISPALNNLNDVIHEVVKLYAQAHSDVQFHSAVEPRLPQFEFDRDQMKRVFVNLLDNAMAAMSQNDAATGKIVHVDTHFNEKLNLALVTLRDNGAGMSEDVRARLFEPYFSTKREGTGLGLAITKRIVNDHDGFIRVQPNLGRGTEFVIELPTVTRRTALPRAREISKEIHV